MDYDEEIHARPRGGVLKGAIAGVVFAAAALVGVPNVLPSAESQSPPTVECNVLSDGSVDLSCLTNQNTAPQAENARAPTLASFSFDADVFILDEHDPGAAIKTLPTSGMTAGIDRVEVDEGPCNGTHASGPLGLFDGDGNLNELGVAPNDDYAPFKFRTSWKDDTGVTLRVQPTDDNTTHPLSRQQHCIKVKAGRQVIDSITLRVINDDVARIYMGDSPYSTRLPHGTDLAALVQDTDDPCIVTVSTGDDWGGKLQVYAPDGC